MRKEEFSKWLTKKGVSKKVCSDTSSRLKRIEKEIDHCDLDEQYHSDHCEHILSLFVHMGNNDSMKKYPHADLPIGKYYMSTYRHAIKQYKQFCDEQVKLKKKK